MKRKLEQSTYGCPIGYKKKKDFCILKNKRKVEKDKTKDKWEGPYTGWNSLKRDGKSPYVEPDHVIMKGSQRVFKRLKEGDSGHFGKTMFDRYTKEGKKETLRTQVTKEIYDEEAMTIGDSLYGIEYILKLVGDMHGIKTLKKNAIGREIYIETLQSPVKDEPLIVKGRSDMLYFLAPRIGDD